MEVMASVGSFLSTKGGIPANQPLFEKEELRTRVLGNIPADRGSQGFFPLTIDEQKYYGCFHNGIYPCLFPIQGLGSVLETAGGKSIPMSIVALVRQIYAQAIADGSGLRRWGGKSPAYGGTPAAEGICIFWNASTQPRLPALVARVPAPRHSGRRRVKAL